MTEPVCTTAPEDLDGLRLSVYAIDTAVDLAAALTEAASRTVRTGTPVEVLIEQTVLALRDQLLAANGRLGRADQGASLLDRLASAATHAAEDVRRRAA